MKQGILKHRVAAIRSKLFVPGSRPELFAKTLHGDADAISFDLEDSVTVDRKDEARAEVAAHLRRARAPQQKVCIVRVNASPQLLRADVHAIVEPGLDLINLPKVESADDILRLVELIAAREPARENCVGILANIETAKGLRNVFEIASAHSRVVGLQLGFLDLATQCGIDPKSTFALNAARLAIRIAATDAGVAAFDGAYSLVKDAEGFRAQAEDARALGMNGKSCIHPSQVALANEVFAPNAGAIAEASRVIRAAEQAIAKGAGASLLQGEMIDAPVAERARRIMQRAELYGLIPNEYEA